MNIMQQQARTDTNDLSEDDKRVAAQLAIGHILRLLSRPTQLGDIEDYERCREIIMAVGPPPDSAGTP